MDLFHKVVEAEPIKSNFTTAIVAVITITDNYLQLKRYQNAYNWTLAFKELLDIYKELPNADPNFIDKQQARLDIYSASALQGLGKNKEAEKVFNNTLKSHYIQTNEGKLEAINYLMSAGRWDEAAENFEVLDKQMQQYGITPTMDIIQHYLLPKYRANRGAHRMEATNNVSYQICDELDTAIVRMQRDAAMELTTIYNTQQKEKELVEQKAHMVRQRYLATILALVLVLFCFVLIIYFRHQSSMRLEKAYSKLEIANERTKESSRMKTSFIQQMSHEIRTPLNILSGFTQILTSSEGEELDEETRQDINEKIIENTNRITELVNKMLELSDVSSMTIIERNDKLSAKQIAQEAIKSVSDNEDAIIPIQLKLGEGTNQLSLQTNEQAATRALIMLLDNAERFTKEGSITLVINQQDNMVQFAVEDTGIGVPVSEAEHIFEEFVQLNEYEVGTGIGLTVARSICRRLGGDVMLDTSYTDGARFVMTLPVC
jgi:signal transduction histidine kinase